jgi:hypothetical protein
VMYPAEDSRCLTDSPDHPFESPQADSGLGAKSPTRQPANPAQRRLRGGFRSRRLRRAGRRHLSSARLNGRSPRPKRNTRHVRCTRLGNRTANTEVQDVATQTQRKTKRASGTAKRAKATANKAGSGGLKKTVEQLQGIAPAGAKLATSLPVKAAVSRLAGKPVSRTRAFMAASAAAAAGAAVTYRLLRSGDQ